MPVGAAFKPDQRFVKGIGGIERGREMLLAHPENAKAAIVRKYLSRSNGINIFRREHRSDHPQNLFLAVKQRLDPVAEANARRIGKFLARQHFGRLVRVGHSAAAQYQCIDARHAAWRQRMDTRRDRFGYAGYIQRRPRRYPALDNAHTIDQADFVDLAFGKPFCGGKYVGEPVSVIIGIARRLQRTYHSE